MHEGAGRWAGSNKVVELKKRRLHKLVWTVNGFKNKDPEFEFACLCLLSP